MGVCDTGEEAEREIGGGRKVLHVPMCDDFLSVSMTSRPTPYEDVNSHPLFLWQNMSSFVLLSGAW